MSANKWMQKLQKLRGAVVERYDPFATVIRTQSPSVDHIFGRTNGLPWGYTSVLYGPPKGGKSVLSHMMMGWVHQSDPEAIVIKIDSEYRAQGQLLPQEAHDLYGIDSNRLQILESNLPTDIFDQIEGPIAALCEAGAPIRMIIVDSISGVQGRREVESESVAKQLIGDHAITVQNGLKKVLPVIRKHKIALVLIAQARAEMDMLEQKRGSKFKMQAGFGLQHMAEYFISVEENRTKAGKTDLYGRQLTNEGVKDMSGKAEKVAQKIVVKMKDSSMGPKGRTGEFTFHFKRGVTNTYEEVFRLATGRKLITLEGATYRWGEHSWRGKESVYDALQADPALCEAILEDLRARDVAGQFAEQDAEAAEKDDDLGAGSLED